MTTTVFVNGVTLTDADWFNDVDQIAYDSDGAAYVDLTPSGTGAVARAIQTWLRERVPSVKDYGVTGDGVTNDYAAILVAEAAIANGGALYWPLGTYNIGSNTWTIDTNKIIHHIGESSYIGPGTRITGSGAITVDTPAYPGGNASRGTTFQGMSILNTGTNAIALRVRNGGIVTKDVVIEATGSGSIGALLLAQWGLKWDNVFISGSSVAWRILPTGASGADGVIGNHFDRMTVSGQGGVAVGLECKGGVETHGNTFTILDIENVTTALDIDAVNNVFMCPHIEANSGDSCTETVGSANIHINPDVGVATTYTINAPASKLYSSKGADAFPSVQGRRYDVTFSAGNFTAGGTQTWTVESGEQSTYYYSLDGDHMTLVAVISNADVGGTPDVSLRIAIPGGFTARKEVTVPCIVVDNGTRAIGIATVANAGTYVTIYNSAAITNWAAATGANSVNVEIRFPIAA